MATNAQAPEAKGKSTQHTYYQGEVQGLRESVLHRLTSAGIVIGLLWFMYVGVGQESHSLRLWAGPLALALCSLLARYVAWRSGFAGAASVYIAGVTLSIGLATMAYPQTPVPVLLALVVGLTSLLISSTAGFLSAAGVVVALTAWPPRGVATARSSFSPVFWRC